ncbi:hypothetical protein [Arthrobacter oryzae]|uniref:hypothetical protein n=1 Tax=Arthrobacter oryzae TaxID=409290 RepID=UPI00278079B6|nr:hypothetical protein [Arthrobacter oryzae]MDQ0077701.1 hypothetical protein [Arthrobacter oryzae]
MQPIDTGSDPGSVPAGEAVAGQGSSAPATSPGPASAAAFAGPPVRSASPPSRSARALTAAPPDSAPAGTGTAAVAGYLIASGGGMLLLSSGFGFMRIRPGAQARS